MDKYEEDQSKALYPFSSFYEIELSKEEFNSFHSIDRALFHRIFHKLVRNAGDAMLIVAFLIWLERNSYSHHTVKKVLEWPLDLLSQLCIEICSCLMLVESSKLSYHELNIKFYLIRRLCSKPLNMIHLYENRYKVIEGVAKIVDEVCFRAFEDIFSVNNHEHLDVEGEEIGSTVLRKPSFVPPPLNPINTEERRFACENPNFVPPPFCPSFVPSPLNSINTEERRFGCESPNFVPPPPFSPSFVRAGSSHLGFSETLGVPNLVPRYELGNMVDPHVDLSEIFGGMKFENGCEYEPHVPADDRTIFLTLSKGYYIPKHEIRDFFTRIYGDFIEEIYMQEVKKDEQPLFARMVCRSSSIIPRIAPPGIKAKYSINGRHIWAKKYVKYNYSSPGTSYAAASTSGVKN